jgi:hypothetical protein
MATVPNRYYNSPWIADAGRNLAMALAPPDPEKTLAAQRAKLELQYLEEAHAQAAADRDRTMRGRTSLGNILTAPAAVAAPTSPGEAAYLRSQHPNGLPTGPADEDIQNVVNAGLPLGELFTALGPDDPRYKQKLGLKGMDTDRAMQLLLMRLASQQDIAANNEAGRMTRAGMVDERGRDLAFDANMLRVLLQEMRGAQGAEHDARVTARGGAGTPLDISPRDDLDLGDAIADQVAAFGVDQLPPEVATAVRDRASQLYQKSRNATAAVSQAMSEFFGAKPNVTEAHEPFGPDLWRDATPASLNLRDGKTLGQIVSELTAGMAPEASEPAAPTAGTPELLRRPPPGGRPPLSGFQR